MLGIRFGVACGTSIRGAQGRGALELSLSEGRGSQGISLLSCCKKDCMQLSILEFLDGARRSLQVLDN